MPVERRDEFGEQHRDFRHRDALFQRGAAAHALAQTQAGVLGDEPPALRYRLNHGELPVGLRLHDQFARAEPESMRGVGEFPRRFHPPHAGTRRAHRPLHEGRKILHAREIVSRGNHDRFGLRRADFRKRAKRGNLVLHMHEGGEGRHDRAERQARLQRRQNRDLLLRRKQQIDPPLPNATSSQPKGSSPKRGTACTARTCRVKRVRQSAAEDRISTSWPSAPSRPATCRDVSPEPSVSRMRMKN
jgi:hypothetical protein